MSQDQTFDMTRGDAELSQHREAGPTNHQPFLSPPDAPSAERPGGVAPERVLRVKVFSSSSLLSSLELRDTHVYSPEVRALLVVKVSNTPLSPPCIAASRSKVDSPEQSSKGKDAAQVSAHGAVKF